MNYSGIGGGAKLWNWEDRLKTSSSSGVGQLRGDSRVIGSHLSQARFLEWQLLMEALSWDQMHCRHPTSIFPTLNRSLCTISETDPQISQAQSERDAPCLSNPAVSGESRLNHLSRDQTESTGPSKSVLYILFASFERRLILTLHARIPPKNGRKSITASVFFKLTLHSTSHEHPYPRTQCKKDANGPITVLHPVPHAHAVFTTPRILANSSLEYLSMTFASGSRIWSVSHTHSLHLTVKRAMGLVE